MPTMPTPVRAEPNVTPMIDVMLVLLIIFMAVGPVLANGFPAAPPVGTHLSEHPDEPVDAVIGVDAAGRYYFNKRPVSETALRTALALRHRANPLNSVAYVRADKNLEYRKVQFVLDLAGEAGTRVVGLITEREPTASKPNHPF